MRGPYFLVVQLGGYFWGRGLRSRELQARAQTALGRILQRDRPPVCLDKITHDRQAETEAGRRFVSSPSSLKDCIALFRDNTWSIVVNENEDTAIFARRLHADSRPGPFACVVQEIAQHLIQVFALPSNRVFRINVHLNIKSSGGINTKQSARKSLGRHQDHAMGAGRPTGVSGACVHQMVVNLTAHPFYLLVDRGGSVGVAFGLYLVCFLRQDGQRRLQTVCQIVGFRQRPLHSFFALFKEQIKIVDQWLHFCRIGPFDPALMTGTNSR